jgi:hypothetical protein
MNAASGKPKRKTSMRVATVFTGVAAAMVGVTQAANAQDAGHAMAKPTARQAVRPAGRLNGSIRESGNCTAISDRYPTWLHVATKFFPSTNVMDSACFGGKGIYSSPPGVGIYGECGGNNYGYIDGTNNNTTVSMHFVPGTTYHLFKWAHYDDVLITSWKGTDKCPVIPYPWP